jgi:hypothetical protein
MATRRTIIENAARRYTETASSRATTRRLSPISFSASLNRRSRRKNGPDGRPFGCHDGGYAQDEWRIRPNFTLHYGLRYEINTPYDDQTHQLGNSERNYPGGRLVVQGAQGLALVNPLWKRAVGNTPFVANSQVGLPITLRNTYAAES